MPDIIIVEDNREIGTLLCDFLRKENYTVSLADTGEKALWIFEQYGANLVVLDIGLPGVDGYSVCSKIRETSNAHIMIATARDDKESTLKGLQIGADDYICKPYDIDILIAKINGIFKRKYALDEIVCDNLKLNNVAQTLTVDGTPVNVTEKEFQLLKLLVENKGTTLKKEYLFNRIWGRTVNRSSRRSRYISSGCGRKSSRIRRSRNILLRFGERDTDMNNYKKFAAKFWGVELMIIALVNVFYYVTANDQEPDIARLQDKTGATGAVYKIIYTQTDDRTWILMNIALGILFLLSVFLICYIGKKIIKPFEQMQSLTEELAKGNLSVPVKAEKSKFLGRFLWGMDMLRETLENNKEKELALQKEKKTLILSLTHDIRTPLSAIRLYAKALAEELYTTGERRAEAYSGIEKNVKEIEEYVNEITLASREDFLQLSVNPGEWYLSEVVEAIRGLYEEKLRNLHTEFQIAAYTNLLLKGDADRLIEVLQNILENAIKYGDGKCISIDFSEEEDCRLITVRNSGCGLKQEELVNLFDSFYRGSNVGSADGSGLGLYISRQLMQKMDGEVFAEIKEDDFCATVVVRKA